MRSKRDGKRVDFRTKIEEYESRVQKPDGGRTKSEKDADVMLHYGPANNFPKFMKIMSNECHKLYQEMGGIIDNAVLPELPEIEDPENADAFNAENDPFGRAKKIYETQLIEREKDVQRLKRYSIPMFSTIYSRLSEESLEKIQESEHYEEAFEAKDPLRLWIIIGATHQGGAIGIPLLDRLSARKEYQSCKMLARESCLELKVRMTDCVDRLIAVGEQEVPADQQAVDYIDKLDPVRFGSLQVELHNDLQKGIDTMPANLTAAFKLASNHTILSKQSGGHEATSNVFAAMKSEKWIPKPPRVDHKQKADKPAKIKEDKKKEAAKPSKAVRKETRNCYICGVAGHLAKDCPDHDGVEEEEEEEEKPKTEKLKPKFKKKAFTAVRRVEKDWESDDEIVLVSTSAKPTRADLYDMVLLDNQATTSIFRNKAYLKNVRRSRNGCDINGIGGKLNTKQMGNNDIIGRVWYDANAFANVWAWSDARKLYKISYSHDKDCFYVHMGNGYKLQFLNVNGLYGCRSKALFNYDPNVLPVHAANDPPTSPIPLKIAVEILIQPTEDGIGQYEGGVGKNSVDLPEQNLVVLPSEEIVTHPTEDRAAKPTEDGARDEAPNIKPTEDELTLEGDVHLNVHTEVLPLILLKAKSASVSKKKCKHRLN